MRLLAVSFFLVGVVWSSQLQAQSMTYQGELNQNGNPANGTFDFQFTLFDGPSIFSGAAVGSPITVNNVPVSDGRFVVELTFPIESFDNGERWMRIRVDGATLSPFQKINRAPYAIQTRGMYVNALQDVNIGTGGFTAFNFGKLFVDASIRPMAIDTASNDPNFPTINAINTSGGPAFWANGESDASPSGGGVIVVGSEAGSNLAIDGNEIIARANGNTSTLLLNREGGNVAIGSASSGSSRLIVPVVQITGGSDFSEMFDVSSKSVVQPGMVVSIDPVNPGKLVPAASEYDRKVAGIISGAGGVATGMRMGQDGSIADGEHPVALTGRVYCLVDATENAVTAGDMLTTSKTVGHAMKADDLSLAQGAIIGKAMTALEKGEQGLVLVLVNLQ